MRLFLITIPIIIILNSCSTTKHVPKNKHLLIRNNIEVIKGEKINTYEVKKIIKQTPNKKVLGGLLKFHLGIYNLTNSENKNSINKYFQKIGEKPVILDNQLTTKSKLQIERYFKNKGYFNSHVDTITTYKNKKAIVDYKISLGKRYTIKNIIYPKFNAKKIKEKKEIKIGDPLDLELLNKEAERITAIFQNNGYYNFEKKSLLYLADTAITDSVTLFFQIDSTNEDLNRKYYLRNINIIIDQDSLILKNNNNINFFNLNTDLKQKTIKRALEIHPGELYSLKKTQQTRNNLSNLKIFKSIYISFSETEDKSSLDCNIFLKKQKKMYYRIEAEGTNSSTGVDTTYSLGC